MESDNVRALIISLREEARRLSPSDDALAQMTLVWRAAYALEYVAAELDTYKRELKECQRLLVEYGRKLAGKSDE